MNRQSVFCLLIATLGVSFIPGVRPAAAQSAPSNEPAVTAEENGDEDERRFSEEFTGAFIEPGIRASLSGGPRFTAWGLDAGLRHSFPFLLGDLRLSYSYDRFSTHDAAAGPDFNTHSGSLHLAIHPLYLALLWSDWWGYAIGSFYVEAGLGGHANVFETAGTPADPGFHWSVGAGIDLPLADPDRGHAPWLHLLYRFRRRGVDTPGGERVPMKLHSGFVGLGWRFNGMLF